MKDTIIGEKVILRSQKIEDASFFAKWYNEEDIMFKCGFTEKTTVKYEMQSIEKRKNNKDERWFTVTDHDGNILGETGLLRMWPEWHCTDLSIILPDQDIQGHGYGTETINLMLELAFKEYNMNRIAIGVVGQNEYALNFYRKVGFKEEGIQEQGYLWNNEYSDFVMMRILYNEWKSLANHDQKRQVPHV